MSIVYDIELAIIINLHLLLLRNKKNILPSKTLPHTDLHEYNNMFAFILVKLFVIYLFYD